MVRKNEDKKLLEAQKHLSNNALQRELFVLEIDEIAAQNEANFRHAVIKHDLLEVKRFLDNGVIERIESGLLRFAANSGNDELSRLLHRFA